MTSNDNHTFLFQDHTIRVLTLDGQPWFVAADACRALGLRSFGGGATRFIANLNPNEVSRHPVGPGRPAAIVTESGLYKLVMRSDKPQARAFQDWVTREVLPTIRKDGAYIKGEEKVRTGEMSEDELILRAVSILQKKVERPTQRRLAVV